ncbi:MAG: tyrosine-type recombinase/integrase [Reyranellaceae bacterium]
MPKITKRFVDSVQANGSDQVFWDTEVKRFGLRVLPSGVKTFVLQYRNGQGRTRKIALGRMGELTADEARSKALKLRAAIKDGIDPSAERQAKRDDILIADLIETYLTDGPAAKPGKKASSWATDASNLRRHVAPLLGRRHLATISQVDVQRFQRDVTQGKTKADVRTGKRGRAIVEGGPGTAARTTAVLSAMLQWAADQGYRSDNPAKGVRLNKLRKRERFLSADELAQLGEAFQVAEAQGINRQGLSIIRLLLLTGARRNEIETLQWDHIHRDRGVARLPDSKTDAKSVPLGAPALSVLSAITRKEGVAWVFPAERGEGHFSGLSKIWRQVAKLAGLSGVRLHDLRHGFASAAVANGVSLYLVGKVLGHTRAETTARYAHLNIDPVRAVADQTARHLADALDARPASANAVPLPQKSR